MPKTKKMVVANWKMNPATVEEARSIFNRTKKTALSLRFLRVVVCPPAPLVSLFAKSAGKNLFLGAQDSFSEEKGSYTGQISPLLLENLGVTHVIIGHSERRARGETDEIVSAKAATALAAGLSVILCIGETARDDEGHYLEHIRTQLVQAIMTIPKKSLANLIIAYEPVWAIGASAAMEPGDIHGMTIFIRKLLGELIGKKEAQAVPILYGGSVNPENTAAIITDGMVDGLLVGRDSLTPGFSQILQLVNQS
jgi:triosephosphate isomerase (TIM)